ncbi:hypothetical protein CHS0354_019649 [Potamilus streckersoni]|uniref:Uncharacterized protein n=1 Tax=Potamilus streckersoni TaxID=2493646 RepID=A0AAE0W934_9BIVA|nr:hypothetical protein CHS0354_019649 [Potamilus streckersoni]
MIQEMEKRNANISDGWVFREVKEAVGAERHPSLLYRRNLLYIEAFVMEVQAASICNVTTVSLSHMSCSVDTKSVDFDVPKNLPLIPDTDSVLFETIIWDDPDHFQPE